MNNLTKIHIIKEWAKLNPKFNITFILSIETQLYWGKDLTIKQENAINNIIKKYRIELY